MTSLQAVRARFARNEGLPFADVLTEASIRDVLNEHGVTYRDRVFSPLTTIWGFLSQVLRPTVTEPGEPRADASRRDAKRLGNIMARPALPLQVQRSEPPPLKPVSR